MEHHTEHKILHELHRLMERVERMEKCVCGDTPRRFIRLQVVAVRFVQPSESQIQTNKTNQGQNMQDNLGIDVPQGMIARIQFAPVDQNGAPAKLDGPVTAVVQGDPASAQVAVSPDGLIVDVKPLDPADSTATVEVDGDADLGPSVNVITTLINVRRLAAPTPQAVSLGAKPENITTPDASQFGQFPTAAPPTARRK